MTLNGVISIPKPFPRYGGGPKIPKVGHVTPSPSVSRGSVVTPYLESSTPIDLFTIQLSLGDDVD